MRANWLRKKLLDPLYWRLSRRELLPYLNSDGIGEIVAATAQYRGRGFYKSIRAYQTLWEITELARLVREARPRTIVEIGTYRGGTLWLWCRANAEARKVISIDLPGGAFGGGYAAERARLYQLFVTDRPQTQLSLLRGSSHAESVRGQLLDILGDDPIDFLFLDGDHTYDGVRADFDDYAPLVRSGGMIAFHDIRTTRGEHGVARYWNDGAPPWERQAIVEFPEREGNGVGVLYKP